MSDVLTDEVARFVRAVGPDPDETLREMDEYAEEKGFPHVGPEVGAFLRLLARMTDATRVFEFGSGYGYSAYWVAEALPDDGEVVLTDVDADLLERARSYLAAGGYEELARFERGDALETIERYEGPFDVVLIDHEKHRYLDAFEAVRPKVPVGGAVVADNAMRATPIQFDRLLEIVERRARARRAGRGDGSADAAGNQESAAGDERADGYPDDLTEETRGVADYLRAVLADPDFETVTVPLGEGIAVSYRTDRTEE